MPRQQSCQNMETMESRSTKQWCGVKSLSEQQETDGYERHQGPEP